MKKLTYNILSPDGFSITKDETYNSIDEAKRAFDNWAKAFLIQGYYSSNNGRINLCDLEYNCTLLEL